MLHYSKLFFVIFILYISQFCNLFVGAEIILFPIFREKTPKKSFEKEDSGTAPVPVPNQSTNGSLEVYNNNSYILNDKSELTDLVTLIIHILMERLLWNRYIPIR